MVRGTGKFKQKRGGGRSFSKDMAFDNGDRSARRSGQEPIEEDGSEEDGSEEDDDSEEESSEEEAVAPGKPGAPSLSSTIAPPAAPELTRQQRREMKKKQGNKEKGIKPGDDDDDEDEDDEDLINPNHVQKKMDISDLNEPRELTRREREQKDKADAKEKYWKLHVAGKTDEAKSDLQRLARIRAEREAAQAKRKAEAESRAQEAEVKRQAQLAKRK